MHIRRTLGYRSRTLKYSRRTLGTTALAITLLAGLCAPATAQSVSDHPIPDDHIQFSDGRCRDDGPVLGNSGICVSNAGKYLPQTDAPMLPESCTWTVNDTAIGDYEFLIYRALQCGARLSKLSFEVFGDHAELHVVRSNLVDEPYAPVVLFEADPSAPYDRMLQLVRNDIGDDYARACRVETATPGSNVLYIDLPEDMRDYSDGPRADCGRLGRDEDNNSFWTEVDDLRFFFDLGQDAYHDIDFDSLTLVRVDDNAQVRDTVAVVQR